MEEEIGILKEGKRIVDDAMVQLRLKIENFREKIEMLKANGKRHDEETVQSKLHHDILDQENRKLKEELELKDGDVKKSKDALSIFMR